MGYAVHLVRTEQWFERESDPVTKEHVDKVLAADPTLSWSEADYVEMTEDDGSRPNNRVECARVAHPTRKGEAPLLAAQPDS